MKLVWAVVLAALSLLAVASGLAKILLTEQEVEFFGKYGFSESMLMAYGVVQLLGGALIPFRATRLFGAAAVAVTFLISLVILLIDGNIPMSIVTAVVTLLLAFVILRSRQVETPEE